MGSLAVSRFSMSLAMMDHDNLEKINLCVQVMCFLFFPIWVWGSAWRTLWPPELRYKFGFLLLCSKHLISKGERSKRQETEAKK